MTIDNDNDDGMIGLAMKHRFTVIIDAKDGDDPQVIKDAVTRLWRLVADKLAVGRTCEVVFVETVNDVKE